MFQQLNHPFPQREIKTSQPRFTRLNRTNNSQSRKRQTTTQHNFPSVNRGYALDSSKENLYYENHLTKVRSACRLDEATIVSKYLSSIRKDFDEMSKASQRELNTVRLKRREIEFLKQKNVVFAESRAQLQAKIQAREVETYSVRAKEDDAKMQTKTLQNIIVRMKRDQIFYKQFGRIRDDELRQKVKDVKVQQEKLIHEEEKLHKLLAVLAECRGLQDRNHELREKKYEDFSGKISEVRERDRFIQERKERTYELQSIELNDTLDEKNIHMREIILAHKVADSMLESKVNSLIKKYADIQGAFHLVKIKTGVNEPLLLTSKFFSYEQTAESLLQTIAENEEYLQTLTDKRQRLAAQYRSLSQEKLSDQDQTCWLNDQRRASWRERAVKDINRSQLLIEQINAWTNRNLKELHEDCPEDAPLSTRFETLCRSVPPQVKKCESLDLTDRKLETMGVRMKKIVKEMTAEELSLRLRQTEDMNESNLIEEDFIKHSRNNIAKKGFSIKQFRRDSGR